MLRQLEALTVDSLATNMVFIKVPADRCAELQAHLAAAGVLAAITPLSRFVLHRDVSAAGIDRTIQAVKGFFAA